jgi:hypothetical protein
MFTVNVLSKKFASVELGAYIFVFYSGRCVAFTDGNAHYIIKPQLNQIVVHRAVKQVFPIAQFIELQYEEVEKRALQAFKDALMI